MSEINKEKKKTRSNFKAVILPFVLMFIFFFAMANVKYVIGLFGYNYVYSEGARVGQVLKFSEKGLIWKTYEGSLGITQSGAYVETWDFSIDSSDKNKFNIISTLSDVVKTGNLVEIKYSQRLGVLPWRSGTSYLVESIELLRQ